MRILLTEIGAAGPDGAAALGLGPGGDPSLAVRGVAGPTGAAAAAAALEAGAAAAGGGAPGFDAALLLVGGTAAGREAGAEAVDAVRRLRRGGAHLPLLLLLPGKESLPEAFRAGADDFLTLPVWPEELRCRLEAAVRRRYGFAQPFLEAGGGTTVFLDGRPPLQGGRPIGLEPRLLTTLVCLARQAGRVVPRGALHAALYPDRPEVGLDAIKVHVCRLRRRLAEAGADRGLVETVADLGYRLRAGRVVPGGRSLALGPDGRAA